MNIELVVSCTGCGDSLTVEEDYSFRPGELSVKVSICSRCSDDLRSDEFKEGIREGLKQARDKLARYLES